MLLWVEIGLMVLFAVLAALPISARTRVVAAVGALVTTGGGCRDPLDRDSLVLERISVWTTESAADA